MSVCTPGISPYSGIPTTTTIAAWANATESEGVLLYIVIVIIIIITTTEYSVIRSNSSYYSEE